MRSNYCVSSNSSSSSSVGVSVISYKSRLALEVFRVYF